jgi:ParB/RepB/Spo0J family partition protein
MEQSAQVVALPERNLGKPLPVRRSQIDADPNQPRKIFNDDSVMALSLSIESGTQETPVKVRTNPDQKGRFILIDGERRWRAFGLISARTNTDPIVLAFVDVITDLKAYYRKSVIANLHREDLHALDEAAALQRLRDDGDTIETLAILRGKSTTYIDNYLRVHGLPQQVKDLMSPNRPKDLQLSITSAIDIARSIPANEAPLRITVAREAIERNLGVVETRTLIEHHTGKTGYGVGGRMRKPSDDYKVFATFIGRTRRDADRFDRQIDFEDMYLHRPDEDTDRENAVRNIRYIIQTLESVLEKVSG